MRQAAFSIFNSLPTESVKVSQDFSKLAVIIFFALKLYHVKLFTGLYIGKVSVFSQQGFDQSRNAVWKIP